MLHVLQDNHSQLQEYLAIWCNKQQEILQAVRDEERYAPLSNDPEARGQSQQEDISKTVQAAWQDLYQFSQIYEGLPNSPEALLLANAKLELELVLSQIAPGFDSCSDAWKSQAVAIPKTVEPRVTNATSVSSDPLGTRNVRSVSPAPKLAQRVLNNYVEVGCSVIIVANAATMGFSAQYEMDNLAGPNNNLLRTLELIFVLFYVIEITLRILVSGRLYFAGEHWKWNLFDLLCVLLSFLDQVNTWLGFATFSSASVVRMLRLLKLAKLLRIIRLTKAFKPLRLILASMEGSFNSLAWVLLLLLMLTYGFGIFFLHGVIDLLQSGKDIDPNIRAAIAEWWYSVPAVLHTMLVLSFGGVEWYEPTETLREAGGVFYATFLFYWVFFTLAIMNTITSFFVEATAQHSANEDEMLIQIQLEQEEELVHTLETFFSEIDESGEGYITLENFCENMEHPRLHAFMSHIDLDVSDAERFFNVLSSHGTVPVDVRTFVVGCIKLKGSAKSVDLFAMFQTIKRIHRQVKDLSAVWKKWSRVELAAGQSHIHERLWNIDNRLEASSIPAESNRWRPIEL